MLAGKLQLKSKIGASEVQIFVGAFNEKFIAPFIYLETATNMLFLK